MASNERLAQQLGRIEEKIDNIAKWGDEPDGRLFKLEKAVFGNGGPGVTDDMRIIRGITKWAAGIGTAVLLVLLSHVVSQILAKGAP